MTSSTNINSHQYSRIVDTCENYLTEAASLYETITKLEGLISALENISTELKNEFLMRCGFLEEVFAVDLDDSSKGIIQAEKPRLLETVIQIQKAAKNRI
jgi:hypothetical protein